MSDVLITTNPLRFLSAWWYTFVAVFLFFKFMDEARAEWPEILPAATNMRAVVVATTTNISARGADPFGIVSPDASGAPSYEWPVCKTETNMTVVAAFVKSIGRDLKSTVLYPAAAGYARSFFLTSQDGRIVGVIHWQKESSLVLVESNGRWEVHDGVVRCVEWQGLKTWIGECAKSWPDEEWRSGPIKHGADRGHPTTANN